MAFCSPVHVFVKTMDKAGIQFPTTKSEIIKAFGDIEVQVADNSFVKAGSIVKKLVPEEYENGSAFMCAYFSASYIPLREALIASYK
jgi:hypothetical protein